MFRRGLVDTTRVPTLEGGTGHALGGRPRNHRAPFLPIFNIYRHTSENLVYSQLFSLFASFQPHHIHLSRGGEGASVFCTLPETSVGHRCNAGISTTLSNLLLRDIITNDNFPSLFPQLQKIIELVLIFILFWIFFFFMKKIWLMLSDFPQGDFL